MPRSRPATGLRFVDRDASVTATPTAPDRFRLGPPLGRGNFGAVYRAYDRRGDRWVALKLAFDDDSLLRAEARALARVVHPNVVDLVASGPGWLALELVDGPNFLEYVRATLPSEHPPALQPTLPGAFGAATQDMGKSDFRSCGPGGFRRIVRVLPDIFAALDAVHRAGFVHRDLQPANVRVAEGERPVLLDFGIAAAPLQEVPRRHAIKASPGATAIYGSPEEASGRVDFSADLYSLGVMLFEAITGTPPFDGGGPDVLVRKQTLDGPAPSEVVADVPEDLDALVERLLRRDPRRRPTLDALRATF